MPSRGDGRSTGADFRNGDEPESSGHVTTEWKVRFLLSVLLAGVLLLAPRVGAAQPGPAEDAIHVATAPTLSVGLQGYAGMGVLANSERADAYALGGGALEVRSSYFQLGGFAEAGELPQDTLQSYGGFVGGWLPFAHWVTFDAALGAGRHTYINTDARYGPGGYSLGSWFGTLRLGVSDRSHGILGARLGAMLFASLDLNRHSIHWRYGATGSRQEVTGVRQVGGFSLGVAFTVGFDGATRSEATTPSN